MPDPDYDIPEYSYRKRRQSPAFDPVMRRIALGAGAIATLIIVVALLWSGIRPGMHFGPVPVIAAPPGPLRIAPASPGGLTVPEANEQIMSGQSSTPSTQLAPAAPPPDISAFLPPPKPAAAAAAAAPAPQANIPPATPGQGEFVLAPQPTIPAVDAAVQVQLAAVISEQDAKSAWRQLNGKMPDLLAGHDPSYSHTLVAGVEFWRLRTGGFADIAAARQFCAAVQARGGACTVAAF